MPYIPCEPTFHNLPYLLETDAPEWIVRAFISGKLHSEYPEDGDGTEQSLYLNTLDGDILIPVDSYIIRSEDGEIFYLK